MPSITDQPPAATRTELTALRSQLSRDVPKKTDDNLLVATWNIREFGGLTEKWRSSSADTPKRDLDSLLCIGEIVSRFDVLAIQEAQATLKALRHMLKRLGSSFTVILTDPVEDDKGDDERLAFVFDRSRVEVSGLACELVVPYSWSPAKRPDRGIPSIALQRQFARTPYAVAFKRREATFILVTLHIYWGSKSSQDIAERTNELGSIATWLREWARDENSWDHNLICLGDFNIDRRGSALWQAFTSTGLTVPEELDHPTDDLRRWHRELLRPDRLVHARDGWDRAAALPALRPCRWQLRLDPDRFSGHHPDQSAEVVPHLGPLPALGRVRAALRPRFNESLSRSAGGDRSSQGPTD